MTWDGLAQDTVMCDMPLKDGTAAYERPVAVVTGASRGIGRCVADNLLKNGCRVVYVARSFAGTNAGGDANAMDQPGESGKLEPTAAYIPCDIALPEDRARLLHETISRFGRVDLLVNNAGIAPSVRRDVLETTVESFEQLMRVNLEGTFFMCQLFANQMVAQVSGGQVDGQFAGQVTEQSAGQVTEQSGGQVTEQFAGQSGVQSAGHKPGRIINIASISSYTSSVSRGEYCISKAGISMVTRLFADRLAAYGIGVFEIRPGIIRTDMTAGVQDKYEKLIADGLTPIKRLGMPQDVADAVLAVQAGSFDFCTGQVFNVDGGFHIRRL